MIKIDVLFIVVAFDATSIPQAAGSGSVAGVLFMVGARFLRSIGLLLLVIVTSIPQAAGSGSVRGPARLVRLVMKIVGVLFIVVAFDAIARDDSSSTRELRWRLEGAMQAASGVCGEHSIHAVLPRSASTQCCHAVLLLT